MKSNWARSLSAAAAITGAVAVAVAGVSYATASTAPPDGPASGSALRTITARGTGTVTVDPDTATIRLGVHESAPTGAEAMEQLTASSNDLIGAVIESGVAEEDIATTNVSLRPKYNRDQTVVTGYEASMNVNATIQGIDQDLSRVGSTIDAAQNAAGEGFTIAGVSFSLADTRPVMEQARVDAGADARRNAEQYAAGAGAAVGEVITIAEQGTSTPPIVFAEFDAAEAAAQDNAGPALVPGQLDLRVTVTVTFVLV